MLVLLYTEAAQEGGGIAFGVPAFEFGKFLFKLGSADSVGIGEVFFGIQGILLLHDVPKHGVALQDGLHDCEVVILEVVLFEHAHALAGALGDGAMGG